METIYQIEVRGQLANEWSEWFGGLRIYQIDPTVTLLVGALDQTALHGVLARIRDLNLTLIAVKQLEANDRQKGENC